MKRKAKQGRKAKRAVWVVERRSGPGSWIAMVGFVYYTKQAAQRYFGPEQKGDFRVMRYEAVR